MNDHLGFVWYVPLDPLTFSDGSPAEFVTSGNGVVIYATHLKIEWRVMAVHDSNGYSVHPHVSVDSIDKDIAAYAVLAAIDEHNRIKAEMNKRYPPWPG